MIRSRVLAGSIRLYSWRLGYIDRHYEPMRYYYSPDKHAQTHLGTVDRRMVLRFYRKAKAPDEGSSRAFSTQLRPRRCLVWATAIEAGNVVSRVPRRSSRRALFALKIEPFINPAPQRA